MLAHGETEAPRNESTEHVSSQAGSKTPGWPAHLDACSPPGYADHMGLIQFRRRFQVLDPLLAKKFLSSTEGIDERKVRGDGCWCGCMPWILLFCRGDKGPPQPAGVRELGFGGKDEGGVRCGPGPCTRLRPLPSHFGTLPIPKWPF